MMKNIIVTGCDETPEATFWRVFCFLEGFGPYKVEDIEANVKSNAQTLPRVYHRDLFLFLRPVANISPAKVLCTTVEIDILRLFPHIQLCAESPKHSTTSLALKS